MEYFIIFVLSFILCFAFVPLAIKTAYKFDILDKPVTKLKKHLKPVPYLGGAAMFFSFAITVVLAKLFLHQTFHGVIGILAGCTLMFLVGLADDVKNLSPYAKFFFQIIAALILLKVNLHIKFMDENVINYVLTIIWVVGVTNAFNIIDIMDGLSGGVALVASIAFFIVAYMAGRVNDMIPAIALAGSLLAFLFFNKPPAKIFMGDAGSLFIGFLLSSLALNGGYSRINNIAVLSPILILGVPIFDTFLVMFMRIANGRLPIYGSDDHLAQRLVMIGFSKTRAVLFLILLTIILSSVAIISTFLNQDGALILYFFVFVCAMMFAIVVTAVDMSNYQKVHHKRK
ncbi:MAG TPA: MraY family glycosyltransferase [Candidatus Goldiibacteriota bacterium]|nr:MraY family glycosyltransferase [Candidatus Goldiibacteriota bacterium]